MALCESPRLEFTEAFTLIGVLLIAIMLYLICTFIVYIRTMPKKRHLGKKKKDKKEIYLSYLIRTGFIFFIIILLAMVIEIVSVFNICSTNKYNNLFQKVIPFIFTLQINISFLVWYLQMYLLLLNTKYNLSKYTNIIYIISSISFLSFTIISTFISEFYIFHMGSVFIYAFQFIFISYLFIYKLCKLSVHGKFLLTKINENETYKTQKQTNDRLIHKLTKLQILCCMSTIMSILSLVIIIFLFVEFIVYFIILLDIFKNFICIILSYSYYHKYYRKICKWLYKPCILTINKCVCTRNNPIYKQGSLMNEQNPTSFKSFHLKSVNSETSSKPILIPKELIENMEIIEPNEAISVMTPPIENDISNKINERTNSMIENVIESDIGKDNSNIKHTNHQPTATEQMEEILDDILDYDEEINTTAHNSDNEESELP